MNNQAQAYMFHAKRLTEEIDESDKRIRELEAQVKLLRYTCEYMSHAYGDWNRDPDLISIEDVATNHKRMCDEALSKLT